jgi:hypothetical protein
MSYNSIKLTCLRCVETFPGKREGANVCPLCLRGDDLAVRAANPDWKREPVRRKSRRKCMN